MLDIKFIRDNQDLVKDAIRKKFIKLELSELISLDDRRREVLLATENLRAEQKKISDGMVNADPAGREQLLTQLRPLKEQVTLKEEELRTITADWREMMLRVPNVPDMTVPEGASDEENVEVRTWGEKPQFDFTPKDHIELCEQHDLADFERGAKVSGFRGYFMKNEGAQLFFALWQYTLDYFVKQGYTPMIVPSLVKREALYGTGYLPQGEEDLYRTQDDEFLAGTAEVAMMSYYSGEVLEKANLPEKFICFSPCFRREAGAHGKDVKGIIRVHEFFKLEQVILCEANHQMSVDFHEEITNHAENIIQALKLPYHVVVNCTGDLGLGQVKKYDIEVWMPSQNK
ncbi:MAG: serine--tRNA ligase, partial [Candidatus Pacebacteria bacterium]|nr:serine--tRNA ligase [Candidatus Paceibacterota bacterium]